MSLCPVPDCTEHYACRIRKHGGLMIAPSALPSRMNKNPPPTANPWWENTTIGEHRPDGSFMPYIDGDATRNIKAKEFSENRHEYEAARRRQLNGGETP